MGSIKASEIWLKSFFSLGGSFLFLIFFWVGMFWKSTCHPCFSPSFVKHFISTFSILRMYFSCLCSTLAMSLKDLIILCIGVISWVSCWCSRASLRIELIRWCHHHGWWHCYFSAKCSLRLASVGWLLARRSLGGCSRQVFFVWRLQSSSLCHLGAPVMSPSWTITSIN